MKTLLVIQRAFNWMGITGFIVCLSACATSPKLEAVVPPVEAIPASDTKSLSVGPATPDPVAISVLRDEKRPVAEVVPQNFPTRLNGKKLNWAIESLFEAQRLIKAARYPEAMVLLKRVEKLDAKISILQELKATAHYLQYHFQEAMDSYQAVLKINPKNVDAVRMTSILKGLLSQANPETDRKLAGELPK